MWNDAAAAPKSSASRASGTAYRKGIDHGEKNLHNDRPVASRSGKGRKFSAVQLDVAQKYGQSAVIHYNSRGKINLLEQPDELRDVLRGAMVKVQVNYAWHDAFPKISSRPAFVRPLLIDAARDINAHKIKLRAKEDPRFSKALAQLVR